jgi:hypothetical protein
LSSRAESRAFLVFPRLLRARDATRDLLCASVNDPNPLAPAMQN